MTSVQGGSVDSVNKGHPGWSSKSDKIVAAQPFETSPDQSPETTSNTPHNSSQFDRLLDVSCDCLSTQSSSPSTTSEDSSVGTSRYETDTQRTMKPSTTSKTVTGRDSLLHDITKFDQTSLNHVDNIPKVNSSTDNDMCIEVGIPNYCGVRRFRPQDDDSSDDDSDDDDDDDELWDD